MRNILRAIHVLAGVAFLSTAVEARVVRIEFDTARSESPVKDFKSSSQMGPVERLIGVAYGEIDPKDPRNALIQDIALAPRNRRGMVEYAATFTLIKPVDASKLKGFLFYEAVNRGNELAPRSFGAGEQSGDEFLLNQGMAILRSGWQGDLPEDDKGNWGGRTYWIKVPVAKNKDGSAVTGPVLVRIFNFKGNTSDLPVRQRAMPYLPASLDTRAATLTSVVGEQHDGSSIGTATTIPANEWAFADCAETPFPGKPNPRKICLKNGFDPNLLYQLVFTAKDPLVQGIGFAATRDITSFFKYAKADDAGTANPIAGRISHAIGFGASQTGQFVRTFIHLGFNQDESGRIVWDGAMPHIAGRQLGLNIRFALPDGGPQPYVHDAQGPLWWSDAADPARGQGTSGLLRRCTTTKTCPKVFETFTSAEMWGLRLSAGLAGTSGKADIPIPDHMRRYFFPGAPHGGGPGGFSVAKARGAMSAMGPCVLAANPNPVNYTMRALVVAFSAWIAKGEEPPPSRYPRISDGTLVAPTRTAIKFPNVPGIPFQENLGNPVFDYDFGPGFKYADVSGVVSKVPPTVKGVVPVRVATVNADGNETSGVPSVLLQAPLGTYLGWNVTASGYYKGQQCSFTGGYYPFATTKEERMAAKDPRPSLQERYGDHEGYVGAVRAAAERATRDRMLLPDDASLLVRDAAASGVLKAVNQ